MLFLPGIEKGCQRRPPRNLLAIPTMIFRPIYLLYFFSERKTQNYAYAKYFMFMVPCIVDLYDNNQQDVAVRSQFYCTGGLLYVFRVLSTPIIRSTLNCIAASGTGHIIVAATFFQRCRV